MVSRLGRRVLLLGAVAAACYAPWMVAVRVTAPPGDRLVKWHFAGTDVDTPDDRSPLDAIVSEYRAAGWNVVGNKIRNVRVTLAIDGGKLAPGVPQPAWGDGFVDTVRRYQLHRLLAAPGVLLVGLFRWRRVPRDLWKLIGAWWLVFVVLEWGGDENTAAWVHVAPLALLVALVAACAVAAPRWVAAVHVPFFVALWLLAPPAFR
jgi:hypothetical protein